MFCRNCGMQLKDTAMYCNNCGMEIYKNKATDENLSVKCEMKKNLWLFIFPCFYLMYLFLCCFDTEISSIPAVIYTYLIAIFRGSLAFACNRRSIRFNCVFWGVYIIIEMLYPVINAIALKNTEVTADIVLDLKISAVYVVMTLVNAALVIVFTRTLYHTKLWILQHILTIIVSVITLVISNWLVGYIFFSMVPSGDIGNYWSSMFTTTNIINFDNMHSLIGVGVTYLSLQLIQKHRSRRRAI